MELSKFKNLKVGDVVRVRQDLSIDHREGSVGVNEDMIRLAGEYITVREVGIGRIMPTIRTLENPWFWAPSMLENIIFDKFEKNVVDPTLYE